MRENLDVGMMVPDSQSQTDNDTIEKYCYDDSPANCAAYGGLYTWHEAMQYDTTTGPEGICPPGWHIPRVTELEALRQAAGGNGNALKALGQGTGPGAGTNASGFSALLAGMRYWNGTFMEGGDRAFFWSSTRFEQQYADYLALSSGSGTIELGNTGRRGGFSIRCIKDESPNEPPAAPFNPVPEDHATAVLRSPTLVWSCRDTNRDPLTYDLYFGSTNAPDSVIAHNQADTVHHLDGLSPGTTYYWRVVGRDDHGSTTSSPVWRFTTRIGEGSSCAGTPTVSYEGRIYTTVQIGGQCWMKENLSVGTLVPRSQDQSQNGAVEKYCYDDLAANCETYGGLYQWNEAMQYVRVAGARGICPPGWHIPTRAEFDTLASAVDGDGNALKAVGQGTGGGAGTDASGFSALLAGFNDAQGHFLGLGFNTLLWASREYDATSAHQIHLSNSQPLIGRYYSYKYLGFSVRCVKD